MDLTLNSPESPDKTALQSYLETKARGSGREYVPDDVEKDGQVGQLEGFARSVVHHLGPGLIGIEPSPAVLKYQIDHPVQNIGAFLVGAAGPYGLAAKFGLKAAQSLPVISRVLGFARAADRVKKNSFISAGLEEVARFAPFELARVGGGALASAAGEEGAFERAAFSAGTELPFFGAFGAGAKLLKSSKKLKPVEPKGDALISKGFPEYEANETVQRRLEQLRTIRTNSSKEELGEEVWQEIFRQEHLLRKQVFNEVPAGTGKGTKAFVQKLDGDIPAVGINALMKEGKPITEAALGTTDEVVEVLRRLELGDEKRLAELIQYPRFLEVTAKTIRDRKVPGEVVSKGIRALLNNPAKGFKKIDNSLGGKTWLAKEADGIWVVAKRIKGRTLQPKEGDQFVFFKTNKPDELFPDAANFGNIVTKGAFHHVNEIRAVGGQSKVPVFQLINKAMKLFSHPDLTAVEARQFPEWMAKQLGPDITNIVKSAGGAGAESARFIKSFVAPVIHQFSASPRAVAMMTLVRTAYSSSASRANQTFYGSLVGKSDPNFIKGLFKPRDRQGGIERLVKNLSDEDYALTMKSFREDIGLTNLRADHGASKEAVAFKRRIQQIHQSYDKEFENLGNLIGEPHVSPTEVAFGRTMTWNGNYRVAVKQRNVKTGELDPHAVEYGSGRTEVLALEDAERLVEQVRKAEGVELGFERNRTILSNGAEDLKLATEMEISNSSRDMISRARVELDKIHGPSITPKELANRIQATVLESERMITDQSLRHLLKDEMTKLGDSHPKLLKQFEERLGNYAGQRGNVASAADKFLDPILGRFMGKDSATEVVRKGNRALFALTLGFGDLGYVTLNAMSPVQVMLPEIAYVLGTPAKRLTHLYSETLVMGKFGPQFISHLSPMKVMDDSMRDLWNTARKTGLADDIERAMTEGHIAPRLIEEVAGKNATQVAHLQNTLKERGYAETMIQLSEYLPGKSEEFGRGLAFTIGRNLGKDVFGLEGEQLYLYAVETIARTNYLYGTADRPKIITGSIGSLFGLFKNWTMNNAANTIAYTGEALRGNYKPLLWHQAGTLTMAGVGGLPLYGAANAMSHILSDEPLVQNIYEGSGHAGIPEKVTDVFQFGIPAFAGISLQSRAATTGNSFMRDTDFMTQSAVIDRGAALGHALGEAINHFQVTGQHPTVNSQHVRDLFYRALLPRTWYRALSLSGDRALRSLKSGSQIMSGLSLPAAGAYILGLTPVDLEKWRDVQTAGYHENDRKRNEVTTFGKALAEARQERNPDAINEILKRATYSGADLGSVMKSSNARLNSITKDQAGQQLSELAEYRMTKALGLR